MENKVDVTESNRDEITLKEVFLYSSKMFKYLRSKWITILIFGLFGAILGFTYSYLKDPIYKSTTTFVLEEGEKSGGLGAYASVASMVGLNVGGDGGGIFQGDNILELYKSRTMIEKTLLTETIYNNKSLLLVDQYIEFNQLRKRWSENSKLANLRFSKNKYRSSLSEKRLKDSILGVIVGDINNNYLLVSKPDKKLSIIKVEVRSKNEFFAKTFADEIVKNVNDFYVQTKTKKFQNNIGILQKKTDSVRKVLDRSIYSGASIVDETPNLNVTRQSQRTIPIQKSQFNAETNKAILSELVKNLELSKISLLKETPLIQVVDIPIYPLEKDRLGRLKGLVLGGILFGFLSVTYLVIKKILKVILN